VFAEEIGERIGLHDSTRLFPFFDDGYVACGPFETLESRLIPLGVPRVHRLRLGSVPLCAWLVCNFKNLEVNDDALVRLIDRETNYFREWIECIDRRWPKFDLNDPIHSRLALEALYVFGGAASVIVYDLLASAVAGPAYLYSLARFASGISVADLGDDFAPDSEDQWRRGRPPLRERIVWSLSFLRWRGLDPHFASIHFLERTIHAPEFFQWVLDKPIGNAHDH
jgi:hypothetical protein